jgi:hypothetical protein
VTRGGLLILLIRCNTIYCENELMRVSVIVLNHSTKWKST